ncbi:MAG TPA: hypothetical protein VFL61_08415 [Gaiellaceae bacterium]|nr:hypothetical protein [Gaiellaceae bacterium]
MKAKRFEQPQGPEEAGAVVGAAPIAITEPVPEPTAPTGRGVVVVFAAFLLLGALMLGASAVPPRHVPWPVLAEPLFVHRSNLAALGIGTVALAFLCLNIAVLL